MTIRIPTATPRPASLSAALALGLGRLPVGMTYGTGKAPGMQTVEDSSASPPSADRSKEPIDYRPRPKIVAPPAAAHSAAAGRRHDRGRCVELADRSRRSQAAKMRADAAAREAAGLPTPSFRLPTGADDRRADRARAIRRTRRCRRPERARRRRRSCSPTRAARSPSTRTAIRCAATCPIRRREYRDARSDRAGRDRRRSRRRRSSSGGWQQLTPPLAPRPEERPQQFAPPRSRRCRHRPPARDGTSAARRSATPLSTAPPFGSSAPK